MSNMHFRHVARPFPGAPHVRGVYRRVVSVRPIYAALAVAAVAGLSGMVIGLTMPRGPVTSLLWSDSRRGSSSGLAGRSCLRP
jgi:hypothetical protein